MNFFNNHIETLEELRKQYKHLLKMYHPDNASGNTGTTQEINAEYDMLFKTLKEGYSKAFENHEKKSDYNDKKYDFEEDKKLREVLNKIICFPDINIEIVGCWIWVCGNTYEYKGALKEIGFKWAREKKKWYFHSEAFRKKSLKKLAMSDIRNYYGSTEIVAEQRALLKQHEEERRA